MQILYDLTYMWNLENQTPRTERERVVWEKLGRCWSKGTNLQLENGFWGSNHCSVI